MRASNPYSKILFTFLLIVGVFMSLWLPCIKAAQSPNISANKSSKPSYVYEQSLELISGDKWYIAVDQGVQSNEVQIEPNKIYFYKVEEGGKRLISENRLEDHFLCTTILRDNSKLIFTVWIGTTYWVRVYSLDKDTVQLDFQRQTD